MDPEVDAPNRTSSSVIHLSDDGSGDDSEFDVDEVCCRSKRRKPTDVLPTGFLAPLPSESMEPRHWSRLAPSASGSDNPDAMATPEASNPNTEPSSNDCCHYLDSGMARSSIQEIPRAPVEMTSMDRTSGSIPLRGAELRLDSAAEKMTMPAGIMIDPGPLDKSLLKQQDSHRSEAVWAGQDASCLVCRRREASLRREQDRIPLDPRILPYIEQIGFYGISQLPFIQLDWHLITALVERWRPETHTFHMPFGEVGLTLQDVSIQFGLPIDGHAVTGSTGLVWADECERLLGNRPDSRSILGGRLKMSWLQRVFQQLPSHADEETIRQYARAHILQLMGGIVFADKTSSLVHLMFLPLLEDFGTAGCYSWGAACLAWLYRQLCLAADATAQEIGGATILLQVWAWDRFPHIAPIRRFTSWQGMRPLACRWCTDLDVTQLSTHVVGLYRDALDRQTLEQIIWMPYTEEIINILPNYCLMGSDLWLARVPLICFNIVEWHLPDRVVRQFGGVQRIPDPCDTSPTLHQLDLRGKIDEDWVRRHWPFICMWQDRRDNIIHLEYDDSLPERVDHDYYAWYNGVTRRYIGRTGAMLGTLVDILRRIVLSETLKDAHDLAAAGMHLLRGHGGVVLFPSDQQDHPQIPKAPAVRGRGRRGRARGQHQDVGPNQSPSPLHD